MEVEEGSKKAVSVTNMPPRWGFGDCGVTSSLQTCRPDGAMEKFERKTFFAVVVKLLPEFFLI